MSATAVTDARVVTPEGVIEGGGVLIRSGRIEKVLASGEAALLPAGCATIRGRGRWLIPGIVDLHNDGLKKELQPRPNASFPLDVAFLAMENRLLGNGVTTIYHAVSFMDRGNGVFQSGETLRGVAGLHRLDETGVINHRVHLRYETIDTHYCPEIMHIMGRGLAHLLSFMDHTPGQGQFKKVENYYTYYSREHHMTSAEVDKLISDKYRKTNRANIRSCMIELAGAAHARGVPLASHDDDTEEKVLAMKELGVGISEFPVALEAARRAAREGMCVAVGAPNLYMGRSTTGNMSALQAVKEGSARVICSDYYPPAMLHTVFRLHADGVLPMHEAVNMVTLYPARAVGTDRELGSIREGRRADLCLVAELRRSAVSARAGGETGAGGTGGDVGDEVGGTGGDANAHASGATTPPVLPVVECVIVNGRKVYERGGAEGESP